MRILVLSDSHASYAFARRCIDTLRPDAVIHLGDYFDDGAMLSEENPGIRFYQVPGNCDKYRTPPFVQSISIERIGGVDFYLTHGHLHGVKSGNDRLVRAARDARVQVALYGHTHVAECFRDEGGMWVMNPGTCGYYGGSAGWIEVEHGKVLSCGLIGPADLEVMA